MYLADALLRYDGPDENLGTLRLTLTDPSVSLNSVEASACALADDLRLESPGQIEKVAAFVGRMERPTWVEWPTGSMKGLLARFSTVASLGPATAAKRLGALVIPTGGSASVFAAYAGPDGGATAIPVAYRIGGGHACPYKSPEEMRAAAWRDPFVREALALPIPPTVTRDEMVHLAWMGARVMAVCPPMPWPTDRTQDMDEWTRLGGLYAMILPAVIASVAILSLDVPEVERRIRKPGELPASLRAGPAADDAQRLSIVTLRLSPAHGHAGGGAAHDRHAPARHFVRGHFFLARNGKMTWRRPHWHGSEGRRVLRRVI